MLVLGLAGQAGTGKDTVADYLVERYGFVKFAFSDALYREVTEAFDLGTDDLLHDRVTKEVPQEALALERCADKEFVKIVGDQYRKDHALSWVPAFETLRFSPRQILQLWGTEYRRAQDANYWVKKAYYWMLGLIEGAPYPELRPQYFVNPTVRFENERGLIHELNGNVWHIHRDGIAPVNAHVSETALPVQEGERELFNNDTVERLYAGVDLMLRTSAKFVRVEPMAEDKEPV